MRYKIHSFAILILAMSYLVFFDCAKSETITNKVRTYQYAVPEKTNDGWETASLSSENLNANLISEMFEKIGDNTYKNITSVIIVKNGKITAEEYFPRLDFAGDKRGRAINRVAPKQLFSATKSVTSILIGIAIERHLIGSVDEKISNLLPEYADIFAADSNKGEIRLKHLLSMTAGLSWDEWTYPYADMRNDALKANLSIDPIRYLLERPLIAKPGVQFTYNTGISVALGRIIQKVSGMPADKFAQRYLFEPLGISDYYWSKLPDEIVEAGGGLFLRPRDMAKIGYVFLNNGRRQGKQIISNEWIKQSTRNYIDPNQIPGWVQAGGYGYQWWLSSFKAGNRVVESYSARGRGGQFILVFPEQQMITVFTGLNDNILMNQPLDMVQRYILPAAIGAAGTKAKNAGVD